MRKMTFTLPDEVAGDLLRRVPTTQRSKFVAESVRRALQERDEALRSACDAVNADPVLNELVEEWQAVSDPIHEAWDYSWDEPVTR